MTKKQAEKHFNEIKPGMWFCPLLHKRCDTGCYNFIKPMVRDMGEGIDGIDEGWVVTGNRCAFFDGLGDIRWERE
jgi:hypothetical protein